MTTIIAFGNKAQHGKDTAVEYLVKKYSPEVDIRRYAFADELKREVNGMVEQILHGKDELTLEMAWQQLCNHYGVKYDPNPIMNDPMCPLGKQRFFLQFWGQYMRETDPMHWINKVGDRIKQEEPEFALLSDMRYENCADWVGEQGGFRVKVTRIGYYNPNIDNKHISEVALDKYPFDYYISVPNGRVDILYALADAVFEHIRERIYVETNV